MAAKDYEIACGMFTAYLAKKKKKYDGTMSSDRREITEDEVLQLVDFYLKNHCIKNHCKGISLDSLIWPGKRLILKFEDIVPSDK